MPSTKFTEAPPKCQLHSLGCQGFCESKREVEMELCQKCLEVRDARFSGAMGDPWYFGYTNYRGEYSQRRATPIRFEFTRTEHHPEEQWIMYAMDHDKGFRAFAMADMVLGQKKVVLTLLAEVGEVQKRFPGIPDQVAMRIVALEDMITNMVTTGHIFRPDEQQSLEHFAEWDNNVRVKKSFGSTTNIRTERQNAYLAGLKKGLDYRAPKV